MLGGLSVTCSNDDSCCSVITGEEEAGALLSLLDSMLRCSRFSSGCVHILGSCLTGVSSDSTTEVSVTILELMV